MNNEIFANGDTNETFANPVSADRIENKWTPPPPMPRKVKQGYLIIASKPHPEHADYHYEIGGYVKIDGRKWVAFKEISKHGRDAYVSEFDGTIIRYKDARGIANAVHINMFGSSQTHFIKFLFRKYETPGKGYNKISIDDASDKEMRDLIGKIHDQYLQLYGAWINLFNFQITTTPTYQQKEVVKLIESAQAIGEEAKEIQDMMERFRVTEI